MTVSSIGQLPPALDAVEAHRRASAAALERHHPDDRRCRSSRSGRRARSRRRGRERECGGGGDQRPGRPASAPLPGGEAAPRRVVWIGARRGWLPQGRRQLGRRARRHEHRVDLLEARALGRRQIVGVDEFVELRPSNPSPRNSRQSSSSSRIVASRCSALRVRVFTVPSGIPSLAATSLCERSLQ